MTVRPFYVAGDWRTGEGTLEVRSPYDQSVAAEVGVPTDADVEEAVSTAVETFGASRLLTPNERAEALMHVSGPIGGGAGSRSCRSPAPAPRSSWGTGASRSCRSPARGRSAGS